MKIPPPRVPMDTDEVLRLRVEKRLSAAEIARQLGYTAPSVRRVLKNLHQPLRPARRPADVRWGERLYGLWRSLGQRCSNARSPLYAQYGGRGVVLADEWGSFWPFYDWAISSGYRPGLNIEIVGRARSFGPRTCRWISPQQRMRRDGYPGGRNGRPVTAFGETKFASEWSRDSRCRVKEAQLRVRLRLGVPPEQAITLPMGSMLPRDGRRARPGTGPRKLMDWERIVDLHTQSGLAPAEIAAQVGGSESTIRKGLKARGAWQRPQRLHPHGTRISKILEDVRRRCEDERDPGYRYYGARGARLCSEWRDVRTFHRWAVEHGYRPGLCLMRREGTKIYSPRNCRWATRAELNDHAQHPDASMPPVWTVPAFGERKGPTEWSRDKRCAVTLSGLLIRLRKGWPPEEAIASPPLTPGAYGVVLRPVTAFGVTKSLSEWSRDRRCKVTHTTLGARLNRGIPPERAITVAPFQLKR